MSKEVGLATQVTVDPATDTIPPDRASIMAAESPVDRSPTLQGTLDTITDSALQLIKANYAHIFLYDAAKEEFTIGSALWRDGRRTPVVKRPQPNGVTSAVVRRGRPLIIANASGHRLFQSPESEPVETGAFVGLPLRHGDRILGVFTVVYREPHEVTQDELLLLKLLANQATVALENQRLFSNVQRRLRGMSALVDMANQVTGNLKLELVMGTTVKVLQGLLGARASSIALLSEDGRELVIEAAAGIDPKWVHKAKMKVGEGVSGRAVSEHRPIYVRDTWAQPDFLFFDRVLRSLIAVPLVSRDEAIGALSVDSGEPNAFDDSDVQLLTIAAAQVSTAIANARLYEEAEDRAQKLAVAYEELKENDRLKDELVQNVSHELRTPLTFVRGYVDLLMEQAMGELNSEQMRTLQIVSDKTYEVTRLVEDIVSLQRIERGNLVRKKFDMGELVEETLAGHRLNADKRGMELVSEPSGSDWMVAADKGRITQVLDNLIVNAMKFSPDGGRITVSVVEDDDKVKVVVADQGIGVPSDKLKRIFDRFYQVDGTSRRRFGGAGIGLAIVKRIIEAHQGQIWVESELDKGSSFSFWIPKSRTEDSSGSEPQGDSKSSGLDESENHDSNR